MIIDSHQHFWKYDPVKHSWINEDMSVLQRDFLPEDFESVYQNNGVQGSIAVQADQSEEETLFLLDQARQYDWIKGVVGWVDLSSSHVADRLAYFSQFPKLKGFRHVLQDEADPEFILRPAFQNGLGLLRDYGFTYDVLIFPHQMEGAIKTVEKHQDQRFVIDHIAKPYIKRREINTWAGHMRRLGSYEHVYCKISGIVTEADWSGWQYEDFVPYLDVVFEAFGTDRLMFGSDYPVCLLAGNFSQVKSILDKYLIQFSDEIRKKIWNLNASTFYGLH